MSLGRPCCWHAPPVTRSGAQTAERSRLSCTNLSSDCVSASDAATRDVAPHALNGVQGGFFFFFLPDLAEQRSARLAGLVASAVRDPVNAGAESPPCSGRGLRSGSQPHSCAGPWLSTPATSVAGEEGEEDEGE